MEDSEGVVWLVSGTLQRFDPGRGGLPLTGSIRWATEAADREISTALVRTGKRIENSFLTIDHSGVLWMATTNGLVRFDRESRAVHHL